VPIGDGNRRIGLNFSKFPEYWLSGWVRVSKNGRKYLSLSLKPKQEKPAESEKKSPAEDFADDIPF
jgi:hypothetical protein